MSAGGPPGAQACTGFLAWAEPTLWPPEEGGLALEGLLETCFLQTLCLPRPSRSLPPVSAGDTDNLTRIHMFCGPHPDPHLHRHTHLRTQYTSWQRAAHSPAQRDCHLTASKTSPGACCRVHATRMAPTHSQSPNPTLPASLFPSLHPPPQVPSHLKHTSTLPYTPSLPGHTLPSQTPTHAHPPTYIHPSHALTGHHLSNACPPGPKHFTPGLCARACVRTQAHTHAC